MRRPCPAFNRPKRRQQQPPIVRQVPPRQATHQQWCRGRRVVQQPRVLMPTALPPHRPLRPQKPSKRQKCLSFPGRAPSPPQCRASLPSSRGEIGAAFRPIHPPRCEADGGPLSTENPPANAASERRDKKTKHIRAVARPRRVRVIARADALPSADRNVAFAQPNPDTAPRAQTQFIAGPAVRIRPAKIAAGRSKEPNSAIGGPFVSAPSR